MSEPVPPALLAEASAIHLADLPEGAAHLLGLPAASSPPLVWPIPADVGHPAEVLVGWLAPASWRAIGLHTAARVSDVAGTAGRRVRAGAQRPARFTTLLARDRTSVSLISEAHDPEPRTITEPPTGWVPDLLARALELPTPEPTWTPAAWIDAVWVDRLAQAVLGRPGAGHPWSALARRHPLVGPGLIPSPASLARRTSRFAEAHPWWAIRALLAHRHEVPPAHRPPEHRPFLEPKDWFDDGTFSRWLQQELPPVSLVLSDLEAVLGPAIAGQVAAALAGGSEAGALGDLGPELPVLGAGQAAR